MFILYPVGAILSVLFTGLTFVLAPIISLFQDAQGNLPKWCSWFQTFDATLQEGRNPSYGFTGSNWWVGVRWLWRNPGYTFDMNVVGIAWDPNEWHVIHDGAYFFAVSNLGAFNFEWKRLKLGWKAENHWDHTKQAWVPGNWAAYHNIPLCFF